MSSWFSSSFSGGLSSLTDQITTFTKDVISETTQEIEDPVTELQLANKKILELSEQTAQYSIELERLRKRKEEFRERAETAEYQVGSNKEQYLKLIKEKENEIEDLSSQIKEMKDQHRKIIMSTKSDSNLPLLANNRLTIESVVGGIFKKEDNNINKLESTDGKEMEFTWGEGNWQDDFDVLDDHVSHSQITQLQSEVARISVECQHWKDLAQQRSKEVSKSNRTDSVSLNDQIEELQQQLEHEKQQHDYELTAIQNFHTQQLEAIKSNHQQEVEKLKSESFPARDEEELVLEVSQLKAKNSHLLEKLQSNQLVIFNLRQAINDLKQLVHHNQDNQLHYLKSEKETLNSYIQDIQSSFQMHQEIISTLQDQKDRYEKEAEILNLEVDQLSSNLKEIDPNQSTNNDVLLEVSQLQEKLDKESSKRESLQLHLSQIMSEHDQELQDILSSKEQLETSLHQAQFELEQVKESKLGSFNDSIDTEKEERRKIEQQLNDTRKEASDYLKNLTDLQTQLQQKNEQLNEFKRQLNFKEEDFSGKIKELEQRVELLSVELSREQKEKKDLKATLDEECVKLKQKNEELSQAVQNCENLRTRLEMLEHDFSTLTEKHSNVRKELDSRTDQLEKTIKERDSFLVKEHGEASEQLVMLQKERDKYKKDLDRLREHLLQVEETHTEEVLQANRKENELKEKLREMENEIAKCNNQFIHQNQQHQLALNQLKQQLDGVTSQRDKAFSELSLAREEATQNVTALQNLQNVLECFQKDQSNEIKLSLLKKEHELEAMREQLFQQQKNSEIAPEKVSEGTPGPLQLEIQNKNETIAKLSSELERYKLTLDKFRKKIEQMSSDEESKVDKSLVKNLFVTYVSARDSQKQEEIGKLIGKILDIPLQEFNQIKGSGSWLPSFLSHPRIPPSPSVVATPTAAEQQSFSKIFVSFLESESKRQSPPKAPPLHIPSHPRPPSHIFVNQPALPTATDTAKLDQSEKEDTSTSLEKLLYSANT